MTKNAVVEQNNILRGGGGEGCEWGWQTIRR